MFKFIRTTKRLNMSRLEVELFDPPPDPDLVCAICQSVLYEPTEVTRCQHVFCRTCIDMWLERGAHTCPTCRSKLTKSDLHKALPALCNIISRLMMHCINRGVGCEVRVSVERLDVHLRDDCLFSTYLCSCGTDVMRRDRQTHEQRCSSHKVQCKGLCELMIFAGDMDTHDCAQALKTALQENKQLLNDMTVQLAEQKVRCVQLEKQLNEWSVSVGYRRSASGSSGNNSLSSPAAAATLRSASSNPDPPDVLERFDQRADEDGSDYGDNEDNISETDSRMTGSGGLSDEDDDYDEDIGEEYTPYASEDDAAANPPNFMTDSPASPESPPPNLATDSPASPDSVAYDSGDQSFQSSPLYVPWGNVSDSDQSRPSSPRYEPRANPRYRVNTTSTVSVSSDNARSSGTSASLHGSGRNGRERIAHVSVPSIHVNSSSLRMAESVANRAEASATATSSAGSSAASNQSRSQHVNGFDSNESSPVNRIRLQLAIPSTTTTSSANSLMTSRSCGSLLPYPWNPVQFRSDTGDTRNPVTRGSRARMEQSQPQPTESVPSHSGPQLDITSARIIARQRSLPTLTSTGQSAVTAANVQPPLSGAWSLQSRIADGVTVASSHSGSVGRQTYCPSTSQSASAAAGTVSTRAARVHVPVGVSEHVEANANVATRSRASRSRSAVGERSSACSPAGRPQHRSRTVTRVSDDSAIAHSPVAGYRHGDESSREGSEASLPRSVSPFRSNSSNSNNTPVSTAFTDSEDDGATTPRHESTRRRRRMSWEYEEVIDERPRHQSLHATSGSPGSPSNNEDHPSPRSPSDGPGPHTPSGSPDSPSNDRYDSDKSDGGSSRRRSWRQRGVNLPRITLNDNSPIGRYSNDRSTSGSDRSYRSPISESGSRRSVGRSRSPQSRSRSSSIISSPSYQSNESYRRASNDDDASYQSDESDVGARRVTSPWSPCNNDDDSDASRADSVQSDNDDDASYASRNLLSLSPASDRQDPRTSSRHSRRRADSSSSSWSPGPNRRGASPDTSDEESDIRSPSFGPSDEELGIRSRSAGPRGNEWDNDASVADDDDDVDVANIPHSDDVRRSKRRRRSSSSDSSGTDRPSSPPCKRRPTRRSGWRCVS